MIELSAITFVVFTLLDQISRARSTPVGTHGSGIHQSALRTVVAFGPFISAGLIISVATAWIAVTGLENALMIGLGIAGLSGMLVVLLRNFWPGVLGILNILLLIAIVYQS